jgi:lauroyl/myristoyl acyltransferase
VREAPAGEVWGRYRAAALLALAAPFTQEDQLAIRRATLALSHCLGLAPDAAATAARRCLLLQRQRRYCDVLFMRLPPPALAELLDTVTAEGLAHLDGLQQERGVLLLSVHYSLSTSLLWLWLARATAQGRFRHLATLFRSGPVGGYADLWRRFGELETVGLLRRETLSAIDRNERAPLGSARAVLAHLQAGESLIALPDTPRAPSDHPRALTVQLGRQPIGFPRGVVWVAERVQCPVVPVHLSPRGNGYAIVVGPVRDPHGPDAARAAVQSVLEELLNQTALAEPAHWEGWLQFPVQRVLGATAVAEGD